MSDELAFLTSEGIVAGEMRRVDWSATPVGPPATWPDALRMTLATMLTSPQPMFLAWGPDFVSFYNDAYRPSLGSRADGALGRRFADLWAEIWDDVGPICERAMAGVGSSYEDLPLTVTRNGVPEETWWSFSYSPLRDATGAVVAMICVAQETSGRKLARRHEAAERERLTTMFEKAPGFMTLLEGPEHRFAYANAAYRHLLGDRDLVGLTLSEAVPEVADQGFKGLLDEVRRSGQAFTVKGAPIELANGPGEPLKERFLDFIYQPMTDAEGRVSGIFVEGHDVTEAHRAGAVLRESEALFRTLFDALDEGVAILEALPVGADGRRDYRYLVMNPAMRAMFGVGELEDETARTHFPDGDEEWYDIFERIFEEGRPHRFERERVRHDMIVDVFLAPVEDQGTRRMLMVMRDVTKRRRDEVSLREMNETLEMRVGERTAALRLLARIVETADTFIQAADLDYRILAINPAASREFTRIFSVPLRVGDDLLERLADRPDQQAAVRSLWARALAGEDFTIIEAFGDPSIARATYEIRFNALRDADGRVTGAFQITTDVTERLAAEARLAEAEEQLRQAQKMEALGQFTGGIAHDFNNLLTPILGGLDILNRRGLGGPRERRLIEGALESAVRARTLVGRLLSFARRQPLTTGAIDVGGLVEGLRGLVTSTLPVTVRLEIAVAPDLPPARADANQLEMAILNLAVNSRDAMPDGGVMTIGARFKSVGPGGGPREGPIGGPALPPGDYLRLWVADTGQGMDEATLARAVEPFFSTKAIGHGTGLGLSMVHGLAAQLGGALAIDSVAGRGTEVALWLPVALPAENVASPDAATLEAGSAGLVLLVDDEDLARASTADMLEDLGYEVIEAASAKEALRLVEAGTRPDLLVTDHRMPGMTGSDLALSLRARLPGLAVLVVSGYAEVEGLEAALPHLAKPFRRAEIAAKIEALRRP